MIIDDAKGLMPRIEHLWAFLLIDKDGDEAVCAARKGDTWMPLVAADEKRVEALREYAQRLAEATGRPIRLVKFTVRQEIEVIEQVKDLAQEALDLSRILGSFLHGRGPLIQGAALADVVSMYIAGHPPEARDTVLALHLAAVKKLIPESEQQIFPNGIPDQWRARNAKNAPRPKPQGAP